MKDQLLSTSYHFHLNQISPGELFYRSPFGLSKSGVYCTSTCVEYL
jgi:hypothetical protein